MSETTTVPNHGRPPSMVVPIVAGIVAASVQPLLHVAEGVVPAPLTTHHVGMVPMGAGHHVSPAFFTIVAGVTLLYGVAFAIPFEWLYTRQGWRHRTPLLSLLAGAGYGGALWLGGAAVAWPLLLRGISHAGGPPLPHLHEPTLVAHLLYGAILGGTVWALTR